MENCKFTKAKLQSMHLNLSKFGPLLLLLFLVFSPGSAQPAFELCFRGKMADIEGNSISQEHFNLKVQLSREHASEILYEFRTASYTDEEGWFGFIIPRLPSFLPEESEKMQPLDLTLEILPNKDTKWLEKGDDFLVTYTLRPNPGEDSLQLTMTRMEGSTLQMHSETHLFAFKDQDPFAYLLGGFLITDSPPLTDQSLLDLQLWLSPDSSDEEGGASRGVKGGFPSGGYYKKK
jgi:hypothetical protein